MRIRSINSRLLVFLHMCKHTIFVFTWWIDSYVSLCCWFYLCIKCRSDVYCSKVKILLLFSVLGRNKDVATYDKPVTIKKSHFHCSHQVGGETQETQFNDANDGDDVNRDDVFESDDQDEKEDVYEKGVIYKGYIKGKTIGASVWHSSIYNTTYLN